MENPPTLGVWSNVRGRGFYGGGGDSIFCTFFYIIFTHFFYTFFTRFLQIFLHIFYILGTVLTKIDVFFDSFLRVTPKKASKSEAKIGHRRILPSDYDPFLRNKKPQSLKLKYATDAFSLQTMTLFSQKSTQKH